MSFTIARGSGLLVVLLAALGARDLSRSAVSLVSNDGAYFVTYTSEPAVIPQNEPFAVEVRVFLDEAHTRPAPGIELALDARMPQHGHGMRREPRVERLGEGHYHVDGIQFHMPGLDEVFACGTEGYYLILQLQQAASGDEERCVGDYAAEFLDKFLPEQRDD